LLATAIIFQGQQCSSREMTTAKVAMKNGDIPKAIENLQTEINKNPKNGEAYILLAELKARQGDLPTAIDLMNQAEVLVANNPTLKDRPAHYKFELFQKSVKDGEEAFNKYSQNKNVRQLETALKHYKTSILLRPAFFEGYRMIGWCNELLDKPDDAVEAYNEYLKVLQPTIDVAVSNNIYVGVETKSLSQKIGQPTFLRGNKLASADSTVLEKYNVAAKDLFIFSIIRKDETVAKVVSWSYDPPQNILPGEREIVPSAITQPINALAVIYYNKKEKDNSLKYFHIVASIDPFDENVNSAIVTLYQELGKPEEAEKAINENVNKNPDNHIFIAQLGDLYMNKGDFDKAIIQYEKALAIKPNFEAALRNVAACYGNKAAKIQQEQAELQSSGKIKSIDPKTYTPFLEKAAEYFKKCLETSAFKNDPDVMGDLCGIYMALLPKEKDLFEKTLKDFENLENILPKERKEQYYFKLLKIYGQTKNPKYSEIENKINQLD
jgi:tetratricopeptide (TPR) repeat protein